MFKYTRKELGLLFTQDNIKNGKSLETLRSWGGTQKLAESLKVNLKRGLQDTKQVEEERIKQYGTNENIVKPPKTLLQMILENFQDDMLKVLCASAIVSLVLGIATEGLEKGWMEGTSILAAVIIIISVTAGNNYIKEKQFQKLNAIASKKESIVIRGGEKKQISAYDMLVGQIQQVVTGEVVSVDGILISSNSLVTDESAMTGEPIELKKFALGQQKESKADPFLVSGSKIIEGTGKMIVLAVGQESQYGILKKGLLTESDQTPLQQKLQILASQIGKVGTICALITFLVLMGHIVYEATLTTNFSEAFFSVETLNSVVQSFIVAVSIIVVSVPQGLPLAVTIALAYSVGKMKEQNNLVRYLQACQTMGGVDNICSDKTGTLTKNKMSVTQMFTTGKILKNFDDKSIDKRAAWLLGTSIIQNSNANPQIKRSSSGSVESVQRGNKTECAILELAFSIGYDYRVSRDQQKNLKIFPFASKNKSMTTIYREKAGQTYIFTKGGPDYIYNQCKFYLNEKGEITPIDQNYTNKFNETVKGFADATLRTLLLTYREGNDCNRETTVEDAAKDLVIIALVGIKDPIRQEIPQSVQKCKSAGVTVRMITGDNRDTAIAIAKQAGILEESYRYQPNDYVVMLGQQFRNFVGQLKSKKKGKGTVHYLGDLTNFKIVADNLKVLARSSPNDKYIMATGLKQLNHVVAMTGDGTNDAPALKKADIGFAMGITGTQVAKEAAGIILLDDNFKSIVTAMKWGRNIFDSIRKFLQFQLTVNFVALVMAFVGASVLKESPLNPIQMLWVNLIMDTLASLALATQPPSEQLLNRKPYSRYQGLITADMWKNIISQGFLQILILGTILFKGDEIFGIPSSFGHGHHGWTPENGKQLSIFFHTFVLLQIFNEINARKLKSTEINVFQNFFNNPLFHVIMVVTIIIQVACIQFGGQSLKAVPLTLNEHLICVGLGISSVFAGIVFKLLIPSRIFEFLVTKQKPQDHMRSSSMLQSSKSLKQSKQLKKNA